MIRPIRDADVGKGHPERSPTTDRPDPGVVGREGHLVAPGDARSGPAAAMGDSGVKTYLDILRRRWPLVLGPTILIPVAAFLLTATQPARFRATSTVYVKQQNAAALATGSPVVANNDPARTLETQATLAGTPAVAARVLASAGVTDMSPSELLSATAISADPNADILAFAVTDASARARHSSRRHTPPATRVSAGPWIRSR